MPLDRFIGPNELLPTWDAFVARYTNNGASNDGIEAANLLNELLSPNITANAFLERHSDVGFSKVKELINGVCGKQSNESKSEGPEWELNNYILTQLLHKWIDVLRDNGMYPPPEGTNAPKAVKDKRYSMRTGEGVGGLLSSAIHSACLRTIGGASKGAKNKLMKVNGADASLVDSEAPIIFHNTLFIFDDTKRDQLQSAGERFKKHLYGRIVSISANNVIRDFDGTISLDQESGPSDDRTGHQKMADIRAVDPSAAAELRDQAARILKIIETELDKREQEIIKKRFGLGEDAHEHTLQELADEFGLSRERIRQIEQKALRIIRSHAHEDSKPSKPPKISVDPTPRTKPKAFFKPPKLKSWVPTDDYPYLSLVPLDKETISDALEARKAAENQHISDMLTAGMSPQWTAKPQFYKDVYEQWQSILAARKEIAAAGIIENTTALNFIKALPKTLLTHAPNTIHAQAVLGSSSQQPTRDLSYNAVFKNLGHIDFRQPAQIADQLVYDPRWRMEAAGYLAKIPAGLLSQQLKEIYKPTCFDKHASFGECLEAYAFCGGHYLGNFLQLYCQAHDLTKQVQGVTSASGALFTAEINQGQDSEKMSPDTVREWLEVDRTIKLSVASRDYLSKRYSLNANQKKCLDFICSAISSLDTAETILAREEAKIKSAPVFDTSSLAFNVFKQLIGIQPDLTPEGLANKINKVISTSAFEKWIWKNRINFDTLLPYIDEVSQALVPDNIPLARRAANLMLGLPSSHEMSFHEAITLAREQGYTAAEFMDMRRYQMRDIIKDWAKKHDADNDVPLSVFKNFVVADKPEGMKFRPINLEIMRRTSLDSLPPAGILDFFSQKLGATTKEDKIAFRQLMYAHALDAGQDKINSDLDKLEKAGDNIPKRKKLLVKIITDIQERDGLSGQFDLSKNIILHAKKNGPVKITEYSMNESISHLSKDESSAFIQFSDRASLIASYAFQNDEARRQRFTDVLVNPKSASPLDATIPQQINNKLELMLSTTDQKIARVAFESMLSLVRERERIPPRNSLQKPILSHAYSRGIIPEDGEITENSIYGAMKRVFADRRRIDSPIRAEAIASFIFPDDTGRKDALAGLFTRGIGVRMGQSFDAISPTDISPNSADLQRTGNIRGIVREE